MNDQWVFYWITNQEWLMALAIGALMWWVRNRPADLFHKQPAVNDNVVPFRRKRRPF